MARERIAGVAVDRRQFIQICALAAAANLAPRWLSAQGGPLDPVYSTIVAKRGDFGRCIHLFGDSIMRGYGLGTFADLLTGTEPLYALRSIASMARLAISDNDLPVAIGYGGNMSASVIAEYTDSGIIRAGDVVVLEDAGEHPPDPTAYERMWLDLRAAATNKIDTICVMMTMFDYPGNGNLASHTIFQYDAHFDGRTMNEATKAAAQAAIPSVGRTLLIDMNARMDDWRARALSHDGVAVMQGDGVHPNVWGQMFMTGEVLRAIGYGPAIKKSDSIVGLVRRNYRALSYGRRSFTAARAEAYAKHCFLETAI